MRFRIERSLGRIDARKAIQVIHGELAQYIKPERILSTGDCVQFTGNFLAWRWWLRANALSLEWDPFVWISGGKFSINSGKVLLSLNLAGLLLYYSIPIIGGLLLHLYLASGVQGQGPGSVAFLALAILVAVTSLVHLFILRRRMRRFLDQCLRRAGG